MKPAPVHVLGDFGGVVDRKGLVAHSEDQIEFLPPQSLELVQHGNAVENVPCLDEQGHDEHRNGGKRA